MPLRCTPANDRTLDSPHPDHSVEVRRPAESAELVFGGHDEEHAVSQVHREDDNGLSSVVASGNRLSMIPVNLAMLLLTIATVILAGLSFWAAVHYGRRAVSEAKSANALASERSVVEWQVDRLDESNAGRFYAANVGHDPAYEVTVVAWDGEDRVTAQVDKLPPSDSDEGPAYVEFRLVNRERQGADHVAGPGPRIPMPEPPDGDPLRDYLAETHRLQDDMIADEIRRRERQQVWVRISWRSELGRWSSVEEQTG